MEQLPGPEGLRYRVRTPRPYIASRLPSGRGATEQPNATGDDAARLTPQFWLLLCATGVATGLLGALMMLLLHAVQHLAFGYSSGGFGAAVARSSWQRRFIALACVGIVGGTGWFLLRRFTGSKHGTHLDDELWAGGALLSFRRSLASSVLSEVVVGGGASLGREAAPKLLGAASGSLLARWRRLSRGQRRLLVACGGGAGMAAVYNVPLAGALITAELLYGSLALPIVLPALACSWIATTVAWVYLPEHPTYTGIPSYHITQAQIVFALLVGPLIGVLAVGYVRLIGYVAHHRATGRWLLPAPLFAFSLLGLLAIGYPQLLGNGKDLTHAELLAGGKQGFGLLLALLMLKPLVTALCLGSGANGGLFTPTMTTGALLGATAGKLWVLVWPNAPVGSYAVIGAAAMLGAAMQAPLSAMALVIELTRTADTLMVPMLAATVLSTALARLLDGYSIYSARLPSRPFRPDKGVALLEPGGRSTIDP